MRIILSRKGFDSASGGYPSPILPDGRMISLPIPEENSGVQYSQLSLTHEKSYCSLMQELMGNEIRLENSKLCFKKAPCCHLDPDIYKNIYKDPTKRTEGWRGVFGQVNGAQTHLEKQGVKEGDLFLFFGWFRNTVAGENGYAYDKMDKGGRHVLFGYLQIGEIVHKPEMQTGLYKWLDNHQHLNKNVYANSHKNTLYLATEHLSFAPDLPGYGIFNFSENLVLTKEGEIKSKWALPDFFKEINISFHKKDSWKDGYFQSAGRGQEFVMEATPQIEEWARDIIRKNVVT
ncbi:MAG: hypothetical protein ACRC8T_03680 [Acidaminococcaceae bacterium]